MTCPAPCFECRILAVCLNSCAYLENRELYWNHIYTWAVGGSHHLNDSNFPSIWINVTNAVFSFRIGCLQHLAQAASRCAIVDCTQAPTLIPFFFFFPLFILEKMVSTSHHTASSCPTLRKSSFSLQCYQKQVVGPRGKDYWGVGIWSQRMACLTTNWLRRKEMTVWRSGAVRRAWNKWGG